MKEEQLKQFEETYFGMSDFIFRNWDKEYELLKASGALRDAEKQKIKLEAMEEIDELFREACQEPSFDLLKKGFFSRLQEQIDKLELEIEKAKSAEDKDHEINLRIRQGIFSGPPKGFFRAAYNDVMGIQKLKRGRPS